MQPLDDCEVPPVPQNVETSTIRIHRLLIMRIIGIIIFSAVAVCFFSGCGDSKEDSTDGAPIVPKHVEASSNQDARQVFREGVVTLDVQVAKQTFRALPTQPELSASIAEQADYIVESSAYWCGQLAQAMERNSVARVRALTEDLPVYLSAHRSTLDLCHAKILASEATIAERLEGSPEVQRKRMAAIDSVKHQLEAVETYLAKCDILWDEVSAFLSGAQSSTSDEHIRDWVSQLHSLMEAASLMLQ